MAKATDKKTVTLNVLGGGCNGIIYGKPAPLLCECGRCETLANEHHVFKVTATASAMQAFKIRERINKSETLSEAEKSLFVLPQGHIIHLSAYEDIFTDAHLKSACRDGIHTKPVFEWIFSGPTAKTSCGFYMCFAGKSLESCLLTGTKGDRLNFLSEIPVWLPQLFDAVHVLHTKCGIAHNDLQLRNIMWNADTQKLTLLDWELAAIDRQEPNNKIEEPLFDQRTGKMTVLRFIEMSMTFWHTPRQQWLDDWSYVLSACQQFAKLLLLYGGQVSHIADLKEIIKILETALAKGQSEHAWYDQVKTYLAFDSEKKTKISKINDTKD